MVVYSLGCVMEYEEEGDDYLQERRYVVIAESKRNKRRPYVAGVFSYTSPRPRQRLRYVNVMIPPHEPNKSMET